MYVGGGVRGLIGKVNPSVGFCENLTCKFQREFSKEILPSTRRHQLLKVTTGYKALACRLKVEFLMSVL